MDRRFEENSALKMVAAIQKASGVHFSQDEIERLTHGPSEEDLVNSGLEDTMITALEQIMTIRSEHGVDLRTAAFINAIDKIAVSYKQLGIFP
jgi:glutamate dehydrogenase (NAD(P)+)